MGADSVISYPAALATGKAHKLPVVPAVFRIYDRLECLDASLLAQSKAASEGKSFDSLLPSAFKQAMHDWKAAAGIEKQGWGKPRLANEKWVYIFKNRDGGALCLDSEFKVTASGDQQIAKYVSWTAESRPKWAKQYPRTATLNRDKILLATSETLYVFVSNIQLPYVRITQYTSAKGFTSLKDRALTIPAGALAQSELLPAKVDLVDAKAVALGALDEMIKARKAFLEYSADPARAAKSYLAHFLWELSKSQADVGKWVRMGEMVRFREEVEAGAKKRAGLAEAKEAFFYAFMLAGLFRETREDVFSSTGKELEASETEWLGHEAAWLGNAPGSQYGLAYLEAVADENTWFSRIFLGDEGAVVKKTLIGLKESELADLVNRFLIGRVLWRFKSLGLGKQELVLKKVGTIQVQIILEIEILVKRLEISVVQFGKYQGTFLKTQAYQARQISRIEYKIDVLEASLANLPTEKWKNAVEGLAKICQGIVLAIEIGNLYGAVKKLAGSDSASEWTENSAEVLDSACDNIAAIGNIAEKALGESWKLGLKRVSLVGSVLDFSLNVRKAYRNADKGRYGLASAYAVMALSAVAMATGAALTAELGATAAFGLTGGPWTMIGALLVMAGIALVYLFTESEIEEWARDCFWGSRGAVSGAPSQLGEQIQRLNELLSKFDAECFLTAVPVPGTDRWLADGSIARDYEYFLVLKIEANLFLADKSKFKVNLGATDINGIGSWDNVTVVPKEQMMSLPDAGTRILKPDPQKAKTIFSQWWKVNDPYARTRAESGRYEFEMKIRLDFQGDEKTLFPSKKPFEKSGDCDFKGLYQTGLTG